MPSGPYNAIGQNSQAAVRIEPCKTGSLMTQALEHLSAVIDQLDVEISHHRERLMPILCKQPPTEKHNAPYPHDGSSLVVVDLNQKAAHLYSLVEIMRELTANLEL